MAEDLVAAGGSPDRAEDAPRSWWLRFDQLLVAVAVLLPVVVALRFSMATVDLAYGIRAGNIMLDTHHVLRTDLFTFTVAGTAWLNQQWLGQVAFAWLYRLGGWELIAIVRAALAGVSFWLVLLACRERGASNRAAAWLTIGALAVSTYGLTPRPQLFAVVGFALALWLIARRERAPRALWILPVITLLWANVHGSFFLVPMLLFFIWLEDRGRDRVLARTEILVAGASLLATLVNPFGVRVWPYLVSLSTNPEIRGWIEEWRPPKPWSWTGGFFLLSLVGVGWVVWRARRRIPWPRYLALAAFALIGLTAVRGIVWWTLAAPVLIADVVPTGRTNDERRQLNTVILVVLIALAAIWLPWFRPRYTSSANSLSAADGLLAYSPEAYSSRVARLAEPGEHVFVPQAWASWFELDDPEMPVMVDSRIELFPSSVWNDYDAISRAAPGWQAIADRLDIDVLVLSTSQQGPLIQALAREPSGWTKVYADPDGALYVRSS